MKGFVSFIRMCYDNGREGGIIMDQKTEQVWHAYQEKVPDGIDIIAIDGRAASGKTTLAEELAKVLGAAVIHMDDFFLPPELRTPQRLSFPGGNVHAERFQQEVLPYLQQGKAFRYRRCECSRLDYGKWIEVPAAPAVIVEGAYSCHPQFGHYADLTVFCHVDPQEQQRRIVARNGEERWLAFRDRWIPMEEMYLAAYHIAERADCSV